MAMVKDKKFIFIGDQNIENIEDHIEKFGMFLVKQMRVSEEEREH